MLVEYFARRLRDAQRKCKIQFGGKVDVAIMGFSFAENAHLSFKVP